MATIQITAPRLVATMVNCRVQITQAEPLDMVTRTITADDQTVLILTQRLCNVRGYQPTIEQDGQQVPNPVDCAMPALQATLEYWIGEAGVEAKTIADIATAAAQAAVHEAALGNLSTITIE